MSKQFDIEKFNNILRKFNQTLYAVKIDGTKMIKLSNGKTITDWNQINCCKKRVMTGHYVWKENFDELYNNDEAICINAKNFCRTETSKKGGVNCQKKYGRKIKLNLNTGIPWNKGMKGNYPYSYSLTKETKEKISKANSGKNNGMHGRKMSIEDKEYRSKLMKEKILNGTFTPNSNNRNTHWKSFYKEKKYRSSWEALYQYFDVGAEYEKLRIKYKFNKLEHIYIVDFVNHNTKTAIEVKPKELCQDKKIQAKFLALREWCTANQYKFVLVDQSFLTSLKKPKDLSDFDIKTRKKIEKLYEINI
jgi:hypothetical protein